MFSGGKKRTRGEEGEFAERRAVRYLKRRGYEILMRNFRVRGGEIDIIAIEKRCLVFVEVRRRAEGAMVDAAESVTPKKRSRMIRAAKAYLARHPKALESFTIRFDVIAFDGGKTEHHKNCFGL